MNWVGIVAGALIAVFGLFGVMCLFVIGARSEDEERDIRRMREAREKNAAAAPDKTVH